MPAKPPLSTPSNARNQHNRVCINSVTSMVATPIKKWFEDLFYLLRNRKALSLEAYADYLEIEESFLIDCE